MRATIVSGMLVAGSLAACTPALQGTSAALPLEIAATAVGHDPVRIARQIVVTFRVEPPALTIEAGATPALRARRAGYTSSTYARQVMTGFERDYPVVRVTDWYIESLGVHCVVYEAADSPTRDTIAARMRMDSRVQDAEAMHEFRTLSETTAAPATDPYLAMQRATQRIGLDAAQKSSSGRGVRIAVIDTGMDDRHTELQGRVEATGNFVDRDLAQYRRDRHGTAVGGAIAANADNGVGIRGVAPEARLIGLKACWEVGASGDASCSSLTLAAALESAIRRRVHVINLSLTGPSDRLLSQLAQRAVAQGILVVGATAAAQPGAAPQFPANVQGVVHVENADAPAGMLKAVAAPGNEVLTLVPGNRYDFASGVSLSTALVSGVAALMLEKVPESRRAGFVARLPDILMRTADERPAQSPQINAARAMQAASR